MKLDVVPVDALVNVLLVVVVLVDDPAVDTRVDVVVVDEVVVVSLEVVKVAEVDEVELVEETVALELVVLLVDEVWEEVVVGCWITSIGIYRWKRIEEAGLGRSPSDSVS